MFSIKTARLFGLMVVFTAIIFTIFFYTCYTNRSFIGSRAHLQSEISEPMPLIHNLLKSSLVSNRLFNIKSNYTSSGANKKNVVTIMKKQRKEPTIDEDALDTDSSITEEDFKEQEHQNCNKCYTSIRLQHISLDQNTDGNISKISEADALIPTSNLQKFMENDDKTIPRKNVKDASIKNSFNRSKAILVNAEVSLNKTIILGKNESFVQKPNTGLKATKNLPKGIVTNQIYETGHYDEELNIDRICPNKGAPIKLLIIITSAQTHHEARLAIRQTWGHYGMRRDIASLFIVGRTHNFTINTALSQENFIYGDLIRGKFIDSYDNLTLKTVSALEWADRNCPQANFVLKTDDDMFVNVPKLLTFLDEHMKERRIIYGRLAKKWKPIRNKKSKYYVTVEQFKPAVFPSFTTGPAYVISSDIVRELYNRALCQTYLKLEDVFTTGIVAQELNIRRVHVNEFLNRRIPFNPCNIRKTISVHMIKTHEQYDLWKKLLDQTSKCK